MNLQMVTITGADDRTDVNEMVEVSREFPFVEWGLLVSKRREGSARFPSRAWIDKAMNTIPYGTKISTHICGRWVYDLFEGGDAASAVYDEMPWCIEFTQRIQINTHDARHDGDKVRNVVDAFFAKHDTSFPLELIFQYGRLNRIAVAAAAANYLQTLGPDHERNFYAAALFDMSGGAGIEPESWPAPTDGIHCGYAGGLGPDNVEVQVRRIESICDRPYWIDMERRVRSDDDSRLDMSKVRRVLATVDEMMKAERAQPEKETTS